MKLPWNKVNSIKIEANTALVKRLRQCEETNEHLTREVQALVFDLEKANASNKKLKHKLLQEINEKIHYRKLYEDLIMEVNADDGNGS